MVNRFAPESAQMLSLAVGSAGPQGALRAAPGQEGETTRTFSNEQCVLLSCIESSGPSIIKKKKKKVKTKLDSLTMEGRVWASTPGCSHSRSREIKLKAKLFQS